MDFNPRPPCGGRLVHLVVEIVLRISIHAPHAGGDAAHAAAHLVADEFQSTPPMRGATAKAHKFLCRFCSKQRIFPDSSCFKAIIQDVTSENNSAAREN